MLLALALFASPFARAALPLEIEVEPNVVAVELDCAGTKTRVDVKAGKAVFPTAPDNCKVWLVKRSGDTQKNGTFMCTDEGCKLKAPPHAPISDAQGRVNIVMLHELPGTRLELVCPGGFRDRRDLVDNVATFDSVPAEECTLAFQGGTIAKANVIKTSTSYRCSVTGTTALCNAYTP